MLGGRSDEFGGEPNYSKMELTGNTQGIKNQEPENIAEDELDDEIPLAGQPARHSARRNLRFIKNALKQVIARTIKQINICTDD